MNRSDRARLLMNGFISFGAAFAYYMLYNIFGEAVANAVFVFTALITYAVQGK